MIYSIEELTHFNCDKCKNWWSIGNWVKVEVVYCPHCGKLHQIDDEEIQAD